MGKMIKAMIGRTQIFYDGSRNSIKKTQRMAVGRPHPKTPFAKTKRCFPFSRVFAHLSIFMKISFLDIKQPVQGKQKQ